MNSDPLMRRSPEPAQPAVAHPVRPLNHRYIAPVLYLAERLASSDQGTILERRLVAELAGQAHESNIRQQPWYRELSDDNACQQLDINMAKQAALVVLMLLLRIGKRKPEQSEYFLRVRGKLGNPQVAVPADVQAHTQLAREYIRN